MTVLCSTRRVDSIVAGPVHQRARALARALVTLSSILFAACTQLEPVERRPSQDPVPVTATLPAEPRRVKETIAAAFTGDKRSPPTNLRRFSVARPGDDYFPRDDQIAANRQALARYLTLPAAAKREDLFLYDFSDADDGRSYWLSEYYVGGRQVPFRCNFLIHLEPAGPTATAIEIFELSPRVWVGKKFSFEAHGPGRYLDVRDVAPTTADRLELLQWVRQLTAR